jgi:prepilin-type N-terminal cleavage/methylation domain-containing protein
MNIAKNKKGFTLIELLIVIAVIAILAALAIPNLISSRKSANETNAISMLRTIVGAEEQYRSRALGGSTTYGDIAALSTKSLITWPNGTTAAPFTKSGYTFKDAGTPDATTWGAYAFPTTAQDGDRQFGATSDGFVRFTTPASSPQTDPTVSTYTTIQTWTALQ